jgi:hypothetical protein
MFDDADRPFEPDAPSLPQSEAEAGPVQAQTEHDTGQTQVQTEPEASPAQIRFRACRWHADSDDQTYCSNRDVLPYAGKGGFDPEAWCPDCTLYKLRRTPRKRPRLEQDDYGY